MGPVQTVPQVGPVQAVEVGRRYQLRPEPLQAVATWLAPYERFWRAKLADLRDLLDTEAQELDTAQEEDHHG